MLEQTLAEGLLQFSMRLCGYCNMSNLAIRAGADKQIKLSPGPMELPKRWQNLVNGFEDTMATEIETCIHCDRPFGDAKWILKAAKEMSLEPSLRPSGRPKKEAEIPDNGR